MSNYAQFRTTGTGSVFVLGLVFLIVLRPHPDALEAHISVYLGDALLMLWLAGASLLFRLRLSWPIMSETALLIVPFITVATIAGVLSGTPGGAAITGARWAFLGGVFLLMAGLFSGRGVADRQITKALDRAFWIVLAVASVQLFEPAGLAGLVHAVYGTDKLRAIWGGYPRIYGTFFNANWFGVYLVFTLSAWLAYGGGARHQLRWWVVRLIPWVGLLIFSGSRTALVGAVILVVAYVANKLRWDASAWRRAALQIPLVVALSSAALFGIFSVADVPLDAFMDRYLQVARLIEAGQAVASVSGRLHAWDLTAGLIQDAPVIGYGMIPGDLIPHNSYLSVLVTVGAVGTIMLLVAFALVAYCWAARVRKTAGRRHPRWTWWTTFSLSLAVMMLVADFIYTSQVMLLWVLCSAMLASSRLRAEHGLESRGRMFGEAHARLGGRP